MRGWWLVTLLLCAAPRAEAGDWASGPLALRSQHPLLLLHHGLRPQSPALLGPGGIATQTGFHWSNTINVAPGSYTIDAETRVLEGTAAFSPAAGWELGVTVPAVWRGSGVSDSVIKEWDRTLGVPNSRRDRFPDDRYLITGDNRDGTRFALPQRGLRLGNIALRMKRELEPVAAGAFGTTLLGEIGLPTAVDGFGQDGVDLLAGVLAARSFERWVFYGGVSGSYFSDRKEGGIEFRPAQLASFLTAEIALSDAVSVLIGCYGASSPVRSVERFPDYELYLDTGLAWRVSSGGRLWFNVRENPVHSRMSTDITLSIGGALSF